jgi:hypothetical protein
VRACILRCPHGMHPSGTHRHVFELRVPAPPRQSAWRLALTLLSLALPSLLTAPQARACSLPPPPGSVTPLAELVPLAGPIGGRLRCTDETYCADGTPELVVRLKGVDVPGTIEVLRGPGSIVVLLRPEEPLQDGAAYDVWMRAGDQENGQHAVAATPAPLVEAWCSAWDAACERDPNQCTQKGLAENRRKSCGAPAESGCAISATGRARAPWLLALAGALWLVIARRLKRAKRG